MISLCLNLLHFKSLCKLLFNLIPQNFQVYYDASLLSSVLCSILSIYQKQYKHEPNYLQKNLQKSNSVS